MADAAPEVDEPDGPFGDSPVEVREKIHRSSPMTLADALREMELVGHDFYLFHDTDTDRASVVYRRRGWSYGVLAARLADQLDAAQFTVVYVHEHDQVEDLEDDWRERLEDVE